jgi:serine/threonine-protein kinase
MSTQTIGRYQIRREIGRGGMATVYHAYDPQFERDVALKLLPREFLHDPEFRRRFHREAKTIASLEHPAIVPVHDFGDADGQLYLVMRLMSGGSLKSRMQKGPIPVTEIARIFARIAQALDSAHALGIVHRDLKPDNILFDQWDEPYLADFGIVKLVQSSKTALTATGGIVGTPAYMSPEQVRSNEQLDGRSDLYALGVILFEMLTGQQPYQANTPIGQAIMHINEPVPRVLAANPSLPEGCQRLIDRVMAKDKENRPDTAEMLAREVAALATPPGDPSPVSPPEQKPVDPPELEAWPETELMIHPDLAPDLPQSAPSSEKADEPSAQRPPVAAAPNADPLATIEDSLPFSPTPAQPAAKPGQPAPSPDPAGADPFLAAPQRSAIPAKPVQTPPAPSPVTAEPPPRLATRFPGARRRWWVIGAPLMLVAALILLLVLRPWSAPSSANGEDGPATLSAYMSQKWEAGYEATALAYGGGQWAMVMSLGAPDVRQSWRLSGEFPAEFIQEKWRDGFDLVDLA